VRDQRDGDERLRLLVGAGDDRAERLLQRVRDVAGAAVAHDPAGHALLDPDVVGHDLLDPRADREHGRQDIGARGDLVQRQVVERDQRGEVVGDARERALQRVGGEDPGRRVDERFQRRLATLDRRRRCGHLT
jgi:hypothetical protein